MCDAIIYMYIISDNDNKKHIQINKIGYTQVFLSKYSVIIKLIFKAVRRVKTTDMFSVAISKFYFKLMNNKLPNCFSSYKPVLPVVNERYEISNPVFYYQSQIC